MWGYVMDDNGKVIKEELFKSIANDCEKLKKTKSIVKRWLLLKEIDLKVKILERK